MCIDAREAMTWWTPDPLAIGAITISSSLYALGTSRLWREVGVGHGVRRGRRSASRSGSSHSSSRSSRRSIA